MIKVRIMGTIEDINWFTELIKKKSKKADSLKVLGVSDIYKNKGTKKFFREYMEIEKILKK